MLVGRRRARGSRRGPQGPALRIGSAGAAGGNGMLVFPACLRGLGIKAPMFPVHTWFPDAAEKAPAGTSTLLVGVLDKVGTYGMIALCLPIAPDAAKSAAVPVMVFAVISIFWAPSAAIASNDLMRLIAYTSVSHFGFIVLGVFSGSSTAMTGAIVYMVAHGVATGALFLTVGFLRCRGGDALITTYGGWQRVTPVIAGVFSGRAWRRSPARAFRLRAGVSCAHGDVQGPRGVCPRRRARRHSRGRLRPSSVSADLHGPQARRRRAGPLTRARNGRGILVAAMLALGFFPSPLVDAVKPTAVQSSTVSIEGSAK